MDGFVVTCRQRSGGLAYKILTVLPFHLSSVGLNERLARNVFSACHKVMRAGVSDLRFEAPPTA
jgi:hypothetical protein